MATTGIDCDDELFASLLSAKPDEVDMLVDIITNGGTFNAKIYEGTPSKYLRYKSIRDCFMKIDDTDRDWENRSQPLLFSGTMFYHYYGEVSEGNSTDYR